MSNQYEIAGREKKVDALMKALDWVAGHPVTTAQVLAMDGAELDYAVEVAAIKPPSDATIQAWADRIRERDGDHVR